MPRRPGTRSARAESPRPARSVGRPRPASRLACRACLDGAARSLLAAMNPDPLDAAGIGVEHLDLERSGAGHELAAHRQPPDPGGEISAERIHLLGRLADVELGADQRHDLFETGAPVGEKRAVRLAYDVMLDVLVVLVLDVADDQLDDVLHRNQTVGAAIL